MRRLPTSARQHRWPAGPLARWPAGRSGFVLARRFETCCRADARHIPRRAAIPAVLYMSKSASFCYLFLRQTFFSPPGTQFASLPPSFLEAGGEKVVLPSLLIHDYQKSHIQKHLSVPTAGGWRGGGAFLTQASPVNHHAGPCTRSTRVALGRTSLPRKEKLSHKIPVGVNYAVPTRMGTFHGQMPQEYLR